MTTTTGPATLDLIQTCESLASLPAGTILPRIAALYASLPLSARERGLLAGRGDIKKFAREHEGGRRGGRNIDKLYFADAASAYRQALAAHDYDYLYAAIEGVITEAGRRAKPGPDAALAMRQAAEVLAAE